MVTSTASVDRPPAADWEVRPVRAGDEPRVARLFEETYGKPLRPERYRWKVLDHAASYPTAWCAMAGDRMVGHYAATPCRFQLSGARVESAQVVDVMTAADFRRRGVLTALGTAANAAWAEAGLRFVFGLPHAGWGSRFAALGWERMFELVWMRRVLRPAALVARRWPVLAPLAPLLRPAAGLLEAWTDRSGHRGGHHTMTPVTVREIDEAGVELDELWATLSPAFESLAVRDRAWIRYRYFSSQDAGYRVLLAERGRHPAGYCVFRLSNDSGRAHGWVADVFTAPDDSPAAQALLRHATTMLRRAGAPDARVLLPPGGWLERVLRRAGFGRAAGSYPASIVAFGGRGSLDSLRDPRRWFTTGGDYDVV